MTTAVRITSFRSTLPDPISNPELYDFVMLGGARTPGLADVAGAGDPRKWDKQDGHGATGATLKFNGDDLSEFEIKLRLWLPEHFRQWQSFKQVLRSKAGDKKKGAKANEPNASKALDIRHPLLEDLNIRAAVVTDRTQLTQTDDGVWETTIKLTAYRPVKAASGVASGSASGSATDWTKNNDGGVWEHEPPTAEDKYDRDAKKLGKRFNNIASGRDEDDNGDGTHLTPGTET